MERTYYAFATQNSPISGQRTNVQVATSPDGVHWTLAQTDALPALPSWATPGNTWAPSVAYASSGNEFVMYYTATEASTGLQCIGAATAPAGDPTGPYTDTSAAPVVCQDGADLSPTVDNGNFGGSIDPDVFTNNSGSSWLIWKSDGDHINVGSVIWSVPLSADLLTPTATTPTQLMTNDAPWQSSVVEGPDMVETPSQSYDLFYGGNDARIRLLRHRLGHLCLGPGRLVHRPVHRGSLAGQSTGHVGTGLPRRVHALRQR